MRNTEFRLLKIRMGVRNEVSQLSKMLRFNTAHIVKIKTVELGRNCFNKQEGQVEWTAGFFFLLFLVIFLCAQLQIEGYQATALYLEDALAASNLASAVIDLEEYGISHTIQIENPHAAFERYQDALKENLSLDENWECSNRSLISGKVVVENYIVYNVKNGVVNVCCVGTDGQLQESTGMLGAVEAPNGVMIESTGIYSEISFPVEGFPGIAAEARKSKLVDVVPND